MAIAQGRKSYLQIGTQSSYASAVAATQKLEFISEDIQLKPSIIPDLSLYNGRAPRSLIDGGIHTEGPLSVRANLEGQEQLWRAALGGYAGAVVDTGVVDHTFDESADPRSLTLQIGRGDTPTGRVFTNTGAKIGGFTFTLPANGLATLDFDTVGKDLQSNQTPTGSLSFPAIWPVKFSRATNFDDGTGEFTTHRTRSLKISYRQPVDDSIYFIGTSVNVDEPIPNAQSECTWELEQYFQTRTAFDLARARTEAGLTLTIQDLTAFGPGSIYFRALTLASPACKCEYMVGVKGYDSIIATSKWTARDSSGSSISAILRNTVAALS